MLWFDFQDCRSELQLASRDSMMKQVKSLEGRMQTIEKQRDEIRNEIFKIESAGNFIEIMLP